MFVLLSIRHCAFSKIVSTRFSHITKSRFYEKDSHWMLLVTLCWLSVVFPPNWLTLICKETMKNKKKKIQYKNTFHCWNKTRILHQMSFYDSQKSTSLCSFIAFKRRRKKTQSLDECNHCFCWMKWFCLFCSFPKNINHHCEFRNV